MQMHNYPLKNINEQTAILQCMNMYGLKELNMSTQIFEIYIKGFEWYQPMSKKETRDTKMYVFTL